MTLVVVLMFCHDGEAPTEIHWAVFITHFPEQPEAAVLAATQ